MKITRQTQRFLPRYELVRMPHQSGLSASIHTSNSTGSLMYGLNVKPERKRAAGVLRPCTSMRKVDVGWLCRRVRVEPK
jgi:hypothetical protein